MGQRAKKRNRTKRRLGRLPPTPEFLQFGLHFHQDIDRDHDSLEDAAQDIIRGIKGEDRRKLRDFIGEILRSDLSPDELRKLWGLANGDLYFSDQEGFRRFLAYIQKNLRKGL